jgi:hypothetical protein
MDTETVSDGNSIPYPITRAMLQDHSQTYGIAPLDLGGYEKLSLVKRFNQKSVGKEKGFGLA